jgi:hypothetical protein
MSPTNYRRACTSGYKGDSRKGGIDCRCNAFPCPIWRFSARYRHWARWLRTHSGSCRIGECIFSSATCDRPHLHQETGRRTVQSEGATSIQSSGWRQRSISRVAELSQRHHGRPSIAARSGHPRCRRQPRLRRSDLRVLFSLRLRAFLVPASPSEQHAWVPNSHNRFAFSSSLTLSK